jgi:hypothetical protein
VVAAPVVGTPAHETEGRAWAFLAGRATSGRRDGEEVIVRRFSGPGREDRFP